MSLMMRGKASFGVRRFTEAESLLVRAEGLLASVPNSTRPELKHQITKWIKKLKSSTHSDDETNETDMESPLNTIAP